MLIAESMESKSAASDKHCIVIHAKKEKRKKNDNFQMPVVDAAYSAQADKLLVGMFSGGCGVKKREDSSGGLNVN